MSTVLVILDGWGHREEPFGNAVYHANTPCFDLLEKQSHCSLLKTHADSVGLVPGQCGNSEVGHLTLGAGRPIPHPRIKIFDLLTQAIENNDIDIRLRPLLEAKGSIHLAGLHSSGGVHGLDRLTYLWCEFLLKYTNNTIFLHLITDGRDQPFGALASQLDEVSNFISQGKGRLKLASLTGRFYAMDRDCQWHRTQQFIDALCAKAPSCKNLVTSALAQVSTLTPASEEFLKPLVSSQYQGLNSGDIVINMNYRTDRARQWVELLVKQDLDVEIFSTVSLHDNPNYHVICPPLIVDNTFNHSLIEKGLSQLRITESEKKPHVTYFFDGLTDSYAKDYEQIIIPSHNVDSWASVPQMKADEIAQSFKEAFQKKSYDFVLINLTNADLVGHSGDLKAAIKACQFVDKALAQIIACLDTNDHLFVTADHGNAEEMINEQGLPHTAHTLCPVKFLYKGPLQKTYQLKPTGDIGQVASTLAQCLVLPANTNWIKSLFINV